MSRTIFDGRKKYVDRKYHFKGRERDTNFVRERKIEFVLYKFELTVERPLDAYEYYIEDIIHDKIKNLSIYKDMVNIVYLSGRDLVFEVYLRDDCARDLDKTRYERFEPPEMIKLKKSHYDY